MDEHAHRARHEREAQEWAERDWNSGGVDGADIADFHEFERRDGDWTLKRVDHQNGGGVIQCALRARERPKGEEGCGVCRVKGEVKGAAGVDPCPKCSK